MVLHGVEVVRERRDDGRVLLHRVEVVRERCDGGRELLEVAILGRMSGALPARAPLPLAPPS